MINAVSKLTWRAFERQYSLTTYERLIAKLDTTIPTYPNWIKGLACALGSAGLAYYLTVAISSHSSLPSYVLVLVILRAPYQAD
ncbi:MAG: hypothetical protein ACLRUM_05070 [Veillonella parvula]